MKIEVVIPDGEYCNGCGFYWLYRCDKLRVNIVENTIVSEDTEITLYKHPDCPSLASKHKS